MRGTLAVMTGLAAILVASPACASSATTHGDPIAPLALALVWVLVLGKLGSEVAARLGQPAVLGELLAGVLIGNLPLLGITRLTPLWAIPALDTLAGLGVLLLLYEVGLESTVGQMARVGGTSLLVATLGVLAPLGLGWAASAWLLPNQTVYVHAFVGATLCATSVGITARVFQDLGRLQTAEARIILGAAVIDDVLGLVVLAVVCGAIASADSGQAFSLAQVGWIVAKAVVFLLGSLLLGVALSPRLFHLGSRLHVRGALLALGLGWCFLLAWLADLAGLAPIVGAFAAGLVLEELHSRPFVERGEPSLGELIKPISALLAPIFFVRMGLHTDLRAFVGPGVIGLASLLTLAAVLGKQACSLGIWRKGVNRWTVGIGMIPRGEVGLIFANVGAGLTVAGRPVIDRQLFSALVAVVILTTLVTPIVLKLNLRRA